MKKTFALAGDNKMLDKIQTLVKSILYYHTDCDIYILNYDIAPEWFRRVNHYSKQINSQIIDVKLQGEDITLFDAPLVHINELAYARYYIPNLIEENKVLYIDIDALVTANVDELFTIDMNDFPLAAVEDGYNKDFNSGVLLINSELWREHNIIDELVNVTSSELQNGIFGDQGVLNLVFKNQWLKLDDKYNAQVGSDFAACLENWSGFREKAYDTPAILHYCTPDKPWNTFSSSRFRDLWWDFYVKDWLEIIGEWRLKGVHTEVTQTNQKNAFIYTYSEDIAYLGTLLEKLPDWEINIAAPTFFGNKVVQYVGKENLKLYPNVTDIMLERVLPTMDVYLDINFGEKNLAVLTTVSENGKPILAVEETKTENFANQVVFSTPEELISKLKEVIK